MKFLLLILSFNLWAHEFEGVLLERGTKKPIIDANVFLLPSKLKATTDKAGLFKFENIQETEVEMIINVPDFEKIQKKITLPQSKASIYLEREFYDVFETTVVGKAQKRDDVTKTLTQSEFKGAAGTFGGDPIRAAQNLAGVNQSQSAQVIIQGSAPDDTGYTIDGHQIPLVFHFQGLSSVLPPDAVSSVDFLPAGYGSEYSRAIGGFIGLRTADPSKDRWHGYAQVDIFNVGTLAQGPVSENGSLLIGARYSYVGQVLKQVAKENDDFNLTTAPTFADVSSVYHLKMGDKAQLKVVGIASRDELTFVLNKPFNDDPKLRGNFYQRTEFFRLIPQFKYRFNEKQEFDFSTGIGKDSILFDINGQYLNINNLANSIRSEFRQTLSEKSTFYIGMDHRLNWYETLVNLPGVSNDGGISTPFSVGELKKASFKGYESELGGYLRFSYKPVSSLLLSPQLRMDRFSQTEELITQPRMNIRYDLSPGLYLRSSAGLYTQAPEPQQYVKEFGNPSIMSPRSKHYTLGLEKDFRNGSKFGWTWGGGLFMKELTNVVVSSSDFRNDGGVLVRKNYDNQGRGDVKGLETTISYLQDPWSVKLAYTYLQSKRFTPTIGRHPSAFDQTHNLNLTGSYRQKRWTYSSRLRYVTGNPYTPVNGASFDADNGVFVPTRGSYFSNRLPAFYQLDFRIDHKWIYDQWILSAYLDIQNLSNNKNAQGVTYSYDYQKKDYVSGFPILPTFGVKGEF